MMWPRFSTTLLASCLLLSEVSGKAFWERTLEASRRNIKAPMVLERDPEPLESDVEARATKPRFLNSKTKPFHVTSMPDVDFDIGEMYAGNIPIGTNKSEALYFVFQPKLGAPVDEITIWLNGGPGCSSLEGFFQENGRFVWQWGLAAPIENPYSWVNLTNVLWVEQPIGTGFAIGTATATNEEDVAAQFLGFFKNFQNTFGISKFKIYVTGESYAGRYVPYISGAMVDKNDTKLYDISGILVYDPCIGEFVTVQEQIPTMQWVKNNQLNLNLNASFVAELEAVDKECGYTSYLDNYLVFPPAGQQPELFFNYTGNSSCDIQTMAQDGIVEINPCWNPYWAIQQCPILWDVLGFPGLLAQTPPGTQIYFDRADVKKAMHAPNITWAECSGPVFVGEGGPQNEGDTSPDPIQRVLPQVIEHTNRVLVANGNMDFVIITNGTLLAIQNMTWNGQMGFQTKPAKPINITTPDLQYQPLFSANGLPGIDGPGQGVMGIQHFERGLMWAETDLSGHMQPQFQPRTSYRHLQWVLGRIQSL